MNDNNDYFVPKDEKLIYLNKLNKIEKNFSSKNNKKPLLKIPTIIKVDLT